MLYCRLLIFFYLFCLIFYFFQEYHQSVKQFGSRSGPSWSGYKWFVKVISRRTLRHLHLSMLRKKITFSKKSSVSNSLSSPASLRCGPWARHIYPSLVLVQPRKTRPCLTERLLMGCNKSNQTNQTVWIQIRSDILSGLVCVQTVCKGYQQTTLAAS